MPTETKKLYKGKELGLTPLVLLLYPFIGLFYNFFYTKQHLNLEFQKLHGTFFDEFFKNITHVGDGIFIIILTLILLFYSKRLSMFVFWGYLISGIAAQILKRIFDIPRPAGTFAILDQLHFIEGVKIHSAHSFPSGHTTSIFALCFALSIWFQKPKLTLLFLVISTFAALSRVYLNHHFLVDTIAGALLGVFTSYLVYKLMRLDKPFLEYNLKFRLPFAKKESVEV